MASRKRKLPAAELRTVDLFSGLTPLEEAERLRREETPTPRLPVDRSPEGEKGALVDSAIRWLGLELFSSEKDDVQLAMNKNGAVLQVIRGRSTQEIRLTHRHLSKLKEMFRE